VLGLGSGKQSNNYQQPTAKNEMYKYIPTTRPATGGRPFGSSESMANYDKKCVLFISMMQDGYQGILRKRLHVMPIGPSDSLIELLIDIVTEVSL